MVKAPSTLGTFLRSFRWGHVRQLDRVSREFLARAWAAGAGPGDEPLTIDLDSTVCETYGLGKEGARRHGYTGQRGYHPLLAVAADTGDVLMVRLRQGRANTARGADHFLRETVGRVRYAGATDNSPSAPTAASTPTPWSPSAARWTSATPSPSASTKACAISSRPYPRRTGRPSRYGWTAAPTWPRLNTHPSSMSPTPRQRGSSSAECSPAPGSQLALLTDYSYHACITDREGGTLELEADHRRHAEIENAIRDLKYGVGLNHLPSGRFAANAAWLAVQVTPTIWLAGRRAGLGELVVTTKTLRRRFFSLAGRLTRKARRLTLHMPPLALGAPVQSRLVPLSATPQDAAFGV